MKKIFLVLAVMTLASIAASAANPEYININFTGYCDVMELTLSGTPKVYLDGVHDLSACNPAPSNVYVGGFQHTIPQYGSFFDLSDPLLGYDYGLPYALEYLTSSNTKAACTWSNYIDLSFGFDFLNNAGTCTFTKPPADQLSGLKSSATLKKQ